MIINTQCGVIQYEVSMVILVLCYDSVSCNWGWNPVMYRHLYDNKE